MSCFAVDSIPAVFAVTTDPFIVLDFQYFRHFGFAGDVFPVGGCGGTLYLPEIRLLAFVLGFIGVKMLVMHWVHIPISVSLSVVFGALGASILTSLISYEKTA